MRSYTRFYWAAWLCAALVFGACSFAYSFSSSYGWFGLFSGVLGPSVFHFELGRLMGFLKNHHPERHVAFSEATAFEIFAFLHPALFRACWLEKGSPPAGYSAAIREFRSAWLFSLLAILSVFLLAWFVS